MVRAEAIAATSTTRRNRDARSLSMFSPKLRALPYGRGSVPTKSSQGDERNGDRDRVTRRVETISQPHARLKDNEEPGSGSTEYCQEPGSGAVRGNGSYQGMPFRHATTIGRRSRFSGCGEATGSG